MIEQKEKIAGTFSFDPVAGSLLAGRKLSLGEADIEEIMICENTKLKLGSREINKGIPGTLLCLRTKREMAQPGRLAVGKSKNLVFYFEENLKNEMRTAIGKLKQNGFSRLSHADEANFQPGKCVIEAKRGCNDYTKAGTTGSNPYGKAGLVSAVILPKVNLQKGTVEFQYLGTTSRFHDSEYFSAHPLSSFDLSACPDQSCSLEVSGGRCTAKAQFRRWDIERDENASGIWYVSFERTFGDVTEAAFWLSSLCGRIDWENAEAGNVEVSEAVEVNLPTSKLSQAQQRELMDMIDALLEADVLHVDEWETIRKRIDEK